MVRYKTGSAAVGPTLVAEWILLIVCLTSPPPAAMSLDNTLDCQGGYTVESSWCTKHRTLPYTCTRSNVTKDIPERDYAIITENNFTDGGITVDNKRVVNISLGLVEQPLTVARKVILRSPPNFHFTKIHVGEIFLSQPHAVVGGFRLSNSTQFHDMLNGTYGQLNKTFPSRKFNLLPTNELILIFYPSTIGSLITSILFESTYDADSQLQVFCDANKTGYIQTRDWDGVKKYPNNIKSCVTIEIPDDHTVLVSLVTLEIARSDRLTIYAEADCAGSGENIHKVEEFKPTVYGKARAISLLFVGTPDFARSGFRFLYSFHPKAMQPTKLPHGKWNCSVPFLSDFKQHFMCSSEVFCSDGQDAVVGCTANELCGTARNLTWELDGFCYRIIKPSEPYTWLEASKKCESIRGRLMNLNSEAKRAFLENILVMSHCPDSSVRCFIYVGFKLSTASKMYRYTRMWSDNTLAVFLRIDSNIGGSLESCGYVTTSYSGSVFTTSCNTKNNAIFLCENVGGRDENYITSNESNPRLSSPSVTAPWPVGKARCKHNHTAHDFLACDIDTNCSAVDIESREACANRKNPAVPFFTCSSNSQPLPYSLVCDHRADCCDSSDEDFCVFPACQNNEFACLQSKQCIPTEKYCDRRSDCVDESDESVCDVTQKDIKQNTVLPPAIVIFTGRGDFVVTPVNSDQCPDTHFRCPGNGSYCMPVYVRCNGVFDCPGKEDEADCDAYTCPGFYRCRGSRICLHHDHLCDSVAQCPQRDDELMCNTACPEYCTCYGYAFICTGVFSPILHPDLRYLEAPGTCLTLSNFSNNRYLIHLGLRHCGIENIGTLYLPNLQSLDLSYNYLYGPALRNLNSLTNLRVLSLAHNPLINVIDTLDRLRPLPLISSLSFAGLSMPAWPGNFSVVFPNVQTLNLSDSGLDRLSKSGFQSLSQIRSLDLKGCPLSTFYPGVFDNLPELRSVSTENYKLCCPSVSQSTGFSCITPTDELSSCDALLRAKGFRIFLGLYALLSLLGNFGSFVYRTFMESKAFKMGFEVFVTHLCVADFLMGVYLAIIGVADRIYYGNYVWNDVIWRQSTACKIAGFLSLLSSEVSAFLICLITLERFLVIRFPFKKLCLTRQKAHVACFILWLIGLLLATIPFTQDWEFYGHSSICVPLPVTRQAFPGIKYSFAVVVILNFVLFVLIAIGQMLIYWSVRANRMPAKFTSKNSEDRAIARRLLAVVVTDFLCWFPIGLLGILARLGVPVPGEVNVAIAIFILPFNSALNPFLYTFNMLMKRHRKSRSGRPIETPEQACDHHVTQVDVAVGMTDGEKETCTEEEAWKQFVVWLDGGVLSLDRVRHRVIDIDNVHM